MKFLPVLDLQLAHSYYSDGRCPDFLIEPTPETERLLRNQRCLLKSLPSGLRILTRVTNQDKPFIPLPKGITFTFQLRLQNPDFALFTELSQLNQTPAPLFTNANLGPGSPVQLALASRQAWSTETLVVQQPAPDEPFTLSGRPLPGLRPVDFAIAGLGATTSPAAYEASTRLIAADTTAAVSGDAFSITYETAPRRAGDVLAEIDIHHSASVPDIGAGPGQFEINFQAKQAHWVYYLVTDTTAGGQFQIEDKDPVPLLFGPANRTDLNQQPDPTDRVAATLARQYPQMQRFRFVSDTPVACQQLARTSLRLRLNGLQIPGALPNPSPRNFAAVTVTTNGTLRQDDGLFRLVKYVRPV